MYFENTSRQKSKQVAPSKEGNREVAEENARKTPGTATDGTAIQQR